METVLDPVVIFILGGFEVGKTSLLRRLMGGDVCQATYSPTVGGNCATFDLPLQRNLHLTIRVIDVGAEMLAGLVGAPKIPEKHPLHAYFGSSPQHVDGAFIVLDCSQHASLTDADFWLDIMRHNQWRRVPKMLLAHKADLPLKTRVISANLLDHFVSNAHSHRNTTDLVSWAFTVGHPQLGDIDHRRGDLHRQNAFEVVFAQMIMQILAQRCASSNALANLYTLLPTPPLLQGLRCTQVEALWQNK